MVEDNFEDDHLSSMTTEDIICASRILENEMQVLEVVDIINSSADECCPKVMISSSVCGYYEIKSNSNAAGRGRVAKGSSATPVNAKSGADVAGSNEDNFDGKDAKSGGRDRCGRGVPASGRGRGGGGMGGFMNFGERKDPPRKGEKEIPKGAANCLDGLTFVISGTFGSLEREEAEDLIKRHGGRVTGSVSKDDYFLCDEDIGGRKFEKAKELGNYNASSKEDNV